MLWRPVMAKMATYREVCDAWTLDDLLEAHELLDEKERQERAAMREARGRG